jgi:hypothetical protein
MLADQFSRNYPDNSSYSIADYYGPFTGSTPDGITRPPCYDRWRVDKVVRDLVIKGNIDPILTYQRQRLQVSATPAFADDYGSYLLQGDLVLDSNLSYGHPLNLQRTGADDEYVWAFGYGSFLYENLSEVVKNFSYKYAITSNGFVKCAPFGLPDEELIPFATDEEVELIDGAVAWQSVSDSDALTAFKGKYAEPASAPVDTMIARITDQPFSDLDIIVVRHSGLDQLIKVKVDGVYETSLIIDGQEVAGTGGGGDEFDIVRPGGDWYFYNGVDGTIASNPSVIKISSPKSFKERTVDLEVAGTGIIKFNGYFLYDQSTRTTIKSIDEEDMGTLRIRQDVQNQRNEVIVIGSDRGKVENSTGEVVNPNNPVFVHTVSRAVDTRSLYDEDYIHYIGHSRSVEIFDEFILSQERANSVAVNTLFKYRGNEVTGSTSFLFDPTLETIDSINISDKYTHLYDQTQVWLIGISEKFSVDSANIPSYITTIGEVSPRPPLSSMRFKPEPDIGDWNNEPIVNLELRYKGYRVAGNDATLVDDTVTIANDPGWPVDLWAGHFLVDANTSGGDDEMIEILSNTSDTLVLDDEPDDWVDGAWAISFDPLDAENGEPLEIRYDQIIDAKVRIQVVGRRGRLIQTLNTDTADLVENWGPGKVIFWNGEIGVDAREGREGFLVSPETLHDYKSKTPIAIKFIVEPLNTTGRTVILSYQSDDDNIQLPTPQKDGLDTLSANNPFGSFKIVTKILDEGYYLGWYASGNVAGADNHVVDAGRMIKYTDLGSGQYQLWIEGRGVHNPIVPNSYNGKYVMSGKSGSMALITDSGNDTTDGWVVIDVREDIDSSLWMLKQMGFEGTFSLWRDGDFDNLDDDAEYPWLSIVDSQFQGITFRTSDNNEQGLLLRFTSPEFWVEGISGNMFQSGVVKSANVNSEVLYMDYLTKCERELTIHHDGDTHTIPSDSDVKFAQFGANNEPQLDDSNNIYLNANTYDKEAAFVDNPTAREQTSTVQIFWSKYYPTRLWMSAGNNPDAHNPEQGSFVIAEVYSASIRGDEFIARTRRRAPSVVPKSKSFVMAPFLEMHQLRGDISGEASKLFGISEDRLREITTFELDLPEIDMFSQASDMLIQFNPTSFKESDEGESIYFWIKRGSSLGEAAIWNILIKPVVMDRAGRTPLNLPNLDVFQDEDTDQISSPNFTRTDWDAIACFWDPDDGSSSALSNNGANWKSFLTNSKDLNLARAYPLIRWLSP